MRSFATVLSGYKIIWGSMFCVSTGIGLYLCLVSNLLHLGFKLLLCSELYYVLL